jgi:hypothetical protein
MADQKVDSKFKIGQSVFPRNDPDALSEWDSTTVFEVSSIEYTKKGWKYTITPETLCQFCTMHPCDCYEVQELEPDLISVKQYKKLLLDEKKRKDTCNEI